MNVLLTTVDSTEKYLPLEYLSSIFSHKKGVMSAAAAISCATAFYIIQPESFLTQSITVLSTSMIAIGCVEG